MTELSYLLPVLSTKSIVDFSSENGIVPSTLLDDLDMGLFELKSRDVAKECLRWFNGMGRLNHN